MYTIIQYTDYRKEVTFSIHGYTTDKTKAFAVAKSLASANAGSSDDQIITIEDTRGDAEYVSLQTHRGNKILAWFSAYYLNIFSIMNLTIKQLDDIYDGNLAFGNVNTSSAIGESKVTKEYLQTHIECGKYNIGTLEEIFDICRERCSEVFAVVRTKEL